MGKRFNYLKINPKEMAKEGNAQTTRVRSGAPVRLWAKAKFLSYRRSIDVLHTQQSLVKIENVNDRKSLRPYHGKRVAYIYKALNEVNKTKHRVMWGKVMRAHGSNGVALCKFRKNLPPRA